MPLAWEAGWASGLDAVEKRIISFLCCPLIYSPLFQCGSNLY